MLIKGEEPTSLTFLLSLITVPLVDNLKEEEEEEGKTV
jgi:hypothetical protein